jgi:ubiquinone/menaquinone biosynthesis C-methylase UbiE
MSLLRRRRAPGPFQEEQRAITRRYDRLAPIYDLYDAPMELMGTRRLRKRLVERARGKVLEIGVGTGKNLLLYRDDTEVTGLDLSPGMLSRTRRRAAKMERAVTLVEGDAHRLPYADGEFDTTLATAVFCSVADPVLALREIGRVTAPRGQILLLEHVRPRNPILGRIADVATWLTVRIFGFRVNRRTEDNIAAAGLEIREVRRRGVWREIVAAAPAASATETATDPGKSS